MKIVHLCLAGPMTDGWAYQENLITKYHARSGLEVTAISSQWVYGTKGQLEKTPRSEYYNSDGVKMIRLSLRGKDDYSRKLKRFQGLYETLCAEDPDLLFVHGCQFLDVDQVVRFLRRHPHVKAFVDNHADYSNSATNWLSRNILHKMIWRGCARKIEPYVIRFYGVLPARVDFLVDVYGIPRERCELLVMGADDDEVGEELLSSRRHEVREQLGIGEKDVLLVTGGKIDRAKRQTLLLARAVREIGLPSLKLLFFGSVEEEFKEELMSLCDGVRVIYGGWAKGSESYRFFSAADLAVFPGRHSVYWEQVAGMGIPMLCKYWDGTTHVDICGNARFLKEDSVEEMKAALLEICQSPELLCSMKDCARHARASFSYRAIAARSIEEKHEE